MKQGVPVPTYHGSYPDESESYHFKELGFIQFYPEFKLDMKDKALRERIKKLGVVHKHEHPEL
jgi:hypothetical protein